MARPSGRPGRSGADDRHGSVVIAVVTVNMMEVTVHEVVDVVSVRDSLVSAAWAMDVVGIMAAAGMRRRAVVGVGRGHLNHVLVDVAIVRVMQVAVVQVVDVAVVLDGLVTAAWAVDVVVGLVNLAIRHGVLLSASAEAVFFDVIKGVDEEVPDVMIRDRVVDVLAASLLGDKTRTMKLLEALRHRGDLLAELFSQLGHAVLSVQQQFHQLKPLR